LFHLRFHSSLFFSSPNGSNKVTSGSCEASGSRHDACVEQDIHSPLALHSSKVLVGLHTSEVLQRDACELSQTAAQSCAQPSCAPSLAGTHCSTLNKTHVDAVSQLHAHDCAAGAMMYSDITSQSMRGCPPVSRAGKVQVSPSSPAWHIFGEPSHP